MHTPPQRSSMIEMSDQARITSEGKKDPIYANATPVKVMYTIK